MQRISYILDFWFSQDPRIWFGGRTEEFDTLVRENFLSDYEDTIAGKNDAWSDSPEGILGLILILDQFSRNMFRNDAQAFSWDFKALYLTKLALKKHYLDSLSEYHALFLIMPLMHSESLPDQELCVELLEGLSKESDIFSGSLIFAREHRDRIAQFGRFPHRNAVLGRVSTPEEEKFNREHGGF